MTQELPADLSSAFALHHTRNFPALLRSLNGALFVSTYQANRLLVCSAGNEDKINTLMRVMTRPMGIALREQEMAICLKNQIWRFSAVFGLGDLEGAGASHEFSFIPRKAHVTGDVAAHQVHFVDDQIYFVNTRFSCICTLEADASFTPVWKPAFISALVAEDRCHLNGFCFDEQNRMRYATALGECDQAEGWKQNKARGGVLIDTRSDKIVARELSMPHSPKLYRGELWLLESGEGRLLRIDPDTGQLRSVISLPGFLRGLSFFDKYAFIGLSKIRESKTFRGLPIEERVQDLRCGVYVVDLESSELIALLEFSKGVEEIFDVAFYPGAVSPHLVGFEGELIDRVISLPAHAKNS